MKPSERDRLHLDVNALRGPRAISPLTYAIAIPGLFLNSFEAELILPGSGIADALVVATLSAMASGLVLLAADKTVLRSRRQRLMPLWLVLGVYIVCGIVRALVSSASAAAVDAQGPEFAVRSLGGVILVVAWLSIIAVVLDYADRDRQATRELRQQQAQLIAQRDYYDIALAEGRDAISSLVDSVVEPAIAQSELLIRRVNTSELVGANDQADELARLALQVRDRAEGQVRNLSHVLSSGDPQFGGVDLTARVHTVDEARGSHWFARSLRQASAIDPIQPLAVTLTVLVEAIPLFTYLFGFRGLLQCAVIGSVVVFLFLWLAREILTPRLRHWNQVVRLFTLTGVVLVTAVLATGSIRLWWPPQTDELVAIGVRSFWVFLVASVVWAIIAASAATTLRSRRDLTATVAEVAWQVEVLRRDLAGVQRGAGQLVHGRVQGRIVAAALAVSLQARALEQGKPGAQAATPGVLEDAAQILTEARADVREIQADEVRNESADVEALLTAVAESWRGVVAVTADVDQSTVAAIDRDWVLANQVAEAAREAVSNAARHGAARSVAIVIESAGAFVKVTARDDGLGVKSVSKAGLGLSQFAEGDGSWSLVGAARSGAILTIMIPVPVATPR